MFWRLPPQAVPQGRTIAVLNQAIGGNRLLLNGLGPNALARFDDDVIAQAGVRSLIVLEGINDIGMLGRTEEATSAEHEQLVLTSSARTSRSSSVLTPGA